MKNPGSNSKSRAGYARVRASHMVEMIVRKIDSPELVEFTLSEMASIAGVRGIQYWCDETDSWENRTMLPTAEISCNIRDFRTGQARLILD